MVNEMEIIKKDLSEGKESTAFENRKEILSRYQKVRSFTYELCKPLVTEDYVIQSMPDTSPTKWHLAHTTWFFETFVLAKALTNYKSLNKDYAYLFNSYYVQAGDRFYRPHRGLLSRPTVSDIYKYREFVDQKMTEFIQTAGEERYEEFMPVIEIGINHEQQHQELLLTDIKHVFSMNPLHPVYCEVKTPSPSNIPPIKWISFNEGIFEIGHVGNQFCYDNETPRYKTYIQPFELGNRLVTNREYLEFIEDGGYKKPEIWLSDGFSAAEREKWNAPLYWEKQNDGWWNFKLNGFQKLDLNEPVCHVSHFEADAFARWVGCRLPTEFEWEVASSNVPLEGNFVEDRIYHPAVLDVKEDSSRLLNQMFGDVWEWTQSAYLPYPGYKTLPGALGEYNGKFMSGQMVLRGGSCATSITHIRKTYRNFFYPQSRWQFMGIRLARDIV
jgi:ergothioneine biosynthesis protein EgtB